MGLHCKLCLYVAEQLNMNEKVMHISVKRNFMYLSAYIFMYCYHFFVQEQDLKLSELESENRKMKVELEEFRTEATHLKNQQATIRRLEERNRQLEQQVSNV